MVLSDKYSAVISETFLARPHVEASLREGLMSFLGISKVALSRCAQLGHFGDTLEANLLKMSLDL